MAGAVSPRAGSGLGLEGNRFGICHFQEDKLATQCTNDAKSATSLYSVMRSVENSIGGGEGVDGLYGSITLTGFQHLLDVWAAECMLDDKAVLVDVGTGLGRPLLHALVASPIRGAFGIEVDPIKCMKARHMVKLVLQRMQQRGMVSSRDMAAPRIICEPVEETSTMGPATHAYSFWEGVPPSARQAFGGLFARSSTLHSVAIVQRNKQDIRAYMESLGFGRLDLVTSFPVKMAGSGRQFQLYVLRKPDWKTLAKSAAMVGDVTPLLPEERPIVVAASDRGRSAGNTPAVGVSEAAQGQASNAHAESTEIEARRASAGASESTVRLESPGRGRRHSVSVVETLRVTKSGRVSKPPRKEMERRRMTLAVDLALESGIPEELLSG